jgi:membrane protein involved in colicin uptake
MIQHTSEWEKFISEPDAYAATGTPGPYGRYQTAAERRALVMAREKARKAQEQAEAARRAMEAEERANQASGDLFGADDSPSSEGEVGGSQQD